MRQKTPRERYETCIKPAIEIVDCLDEVKDLGKSYDEFVDLVATRMDTMNRLYCKHSYASWRVAQRDGMWNAIVSPYFGDNIGYVEALAFAAVWLEFIVQVAERFGAGDDYMDFVLRRYLQNYMYSETYFDEYSNRCWFDASSVIQDCESYYEHAMREARHCIYHADEDEDWCDDDEEYDDEEESERE